MFSLSLHAFESFLFLLLLENKFRELTEPELSAYRRVYSRGYSSTIIRRIIGEMGEKRIEYHIQKQSRNFIQICHLCLGAEIYSHDGSESSFTRFLIGWVTS